MVSTKTRAGLIAGAALAAPAAGLVLGTGDVSASPALVPPLDPAISAEINGMLDQVSETIPNSPELPRLPMPIPGEAGAPAQNQFRKTADQRLTTDSPASGGDGTGTSNPLNLNLTAADVAQLRIQADVQNVINGIQFMLETPSDGEFQSLVERASTNLQERTGGDLQNPLTWPEGVTRFVREGTDEVTGSDAWKDLWSTQYDPFRGAENRDQAVTNLSELIDLAVTDPQSALTRTLDAGGGLDAWLADPIEALLRAAEPVIGEEGAADLRIVLTHTIERVGEATPFVLERTAPSLIPILVGALGGSILGALFGGFLGALTGGAIGALSPLSFIEGLLGLLPGALLGGGITGLMGLIGSTLLSLPLAALGPLMGAAVGTTILLVALSTIIFGGWLLLLLIPAVIVAVLALIVAGVLTIGATVLGLVVGGVIVGIPTGGVGIIALLPFLIAAIPIIAAALVAATFGGFIVTLFLTAFLTALAPIALWAVLAPWAVIAGSTLGGLSGLLAALPLIGLLIPALTALSTIPGALAGSITGYLAATTLFALLNALLGAGIGGTVGAGMGALSGAPQGALAGVPLALLMALALGIPAIDEWLRNNPDAELEGALSRLGSLLNDAWNESNTKRVLDELGAWLGRFAEETGIQDILDYLGDRSLGLQAAISDLLSSFLSGYMDPDNILKSSLIGALLGALLGAMLGFLIGSTDPRNLLSAIPGALLGAPLGGLLGATLGSLLSDLLGLLAAAASIPLTFLPNLALLSLAWLLPGALLTLLTFAAALIPPLAIAVAATVIVSLGVTAPIWIPLMVISAALLVVTLFLLNAGLTSGVAAITGGIAGALTVAWTVLVIVAIAIGALVVGVPTFVLLMPLFVFPSLAVPLAIALGLPFLLPMALGLSLLQAPWIGGAVDLLSKLFTIPAGAALGTLAGALTGALLAVLGTALLHGSFDALLGALLGAAPGAVIGGLVGMFLPKGALEDLGGRLLADPLVQGLPETGTPEMELRVDVPQPAHVYYGREDAPDATIDRELIDVDMDMLTPA